MIEKFTPAAIAFGAALIAGSLYLKPTEFETCVDLFTEQLLAVKKVKLEVAKFVATEDCINN